jgi:hypothetical protein
MMDFFFLDTDLQGQKKVKIWSLISLHAHLNLLKKKKQLLSILSKQKNYKKIIYLAAAKPGFQLYEGERTMPAQKCQVEVFISFLILSVFLS